MRTCKECRDFAACMAIARALGEKFNPDYEGERLCAYKGFTPMTNADRIRAMSDEELAKLIVKHKPVYSWCKGVREIWMQPNVTKEQAWVKWLQQPAEGSL